MSVLRIPSQSQLSHAYSQASLHRSVSQLMDSPDKKALTEDSLWETIMGHSSGLVSVSACCTHTAAVHTNCVVNWFNSVAVWYQGRNCC